MKQFRYKEWLFVEVPQGNHPRLIESMGGGDYLKIGEVYTTLPQGQHSIIGKADELTENMFLQSVIIHYGMELSQTIVLKVKE